jgi:hypothetical protein
MKNIKQIRENFDIITEKEEKEERKLSALVRAGLYDAKKLPALKKALEKSADKMTSQEKRMLLNLLDSLISQVTSDEQIYRKVKQNVHNVSEAKEDYYSKFDPRSKAGYPTDKDMPSVLILKRKAIRVYPDNQKVALYYSQVLDKYVTIPFNDIQFGLNEDKKSDDEKKKKRNIRAKIAGPRVEMRRRAIDAAHLINKSGEYSSPTERFTNVAGRVGKAGAVGVMVNDYFRKREISKALDTRSQKRAKVPNLNENPLVHLVPLIANIAKGSTKLIKGTKNLSTAEKSAARLAKMNKAEKSGKAAKFGKEAKAAKLGKTGKNNKGKWLKRGAAAAGLAGATLGGGTTGSQQNSNAPSMPNYSFSAKPQISNPWQDRNRSDYRSDSTKATQQRDVQLNRKSQQALVSEDVLSTMKAMIDNDIREATVTINEQEININNSIAKRILFLYESINKPNKKKMEKMLNESATSFNKVLTFALRQ